LFSSAIRHADSYAVGDYTPALQDVRRQLIQLNNTLRWDMVVVFDGGNSPLKRHERARIDSSCSNSTAPADSIRNQPIVYIDLAAKICRDSFIDYVVAPEEADPQCTFTVFVGGVDFVPSLVVTGDSDLIGYGKTKVMIVSSWSQEFGPSIFHWHAACLGCDFTENASGILGVGYKTFHKCAKKLFEETCDSDNDVSSTRAHFVKIASNLHA
jgi:5'-3' exonuclease